MNKELFNLMVELEYKFDLELNYYFELEEFQREELTESLISYFAAYINSHENAPKILISVLKSMVRESIKQEEYEKAEIYTRFLKRLKELTF